MPDINGAWHLFLSLAPNCSGTLWILSSLRQRTKRNSSQSSFAGGIPGSARTLLAPNLARMTDLPSPLPSLGHRRISSPDNGAVRTDLLERVVVTTDASLQGWGAHCRGHLAQGVWTSVESRRSINWLELRAIYLALRTFHHLVSNSHVLVLTDNITAKAHVNHQGGTRSLSLMSEVLRLGLWSEIHLASLRAEHISGVTNLQADWLSRQRLDHAEWRLNPRLFHQITTRFGMPVLDLFATLDNAQLPRFISRFPSAQAEAVDALRSPWPPGLLYAFPPVSLLPRVIRKLLMEQAEIILVAPHWPRRPWFADLVSLSITQPWQLPQPQDALTQGTLRHPDLQWLRLTTWRLSGTCLGRSASLQT
ncbi:uncharacterized protein LOC132712109 [Pantherophis guttatus]|uniref:Uncharacterized protein LOC132712109 n=1 Tax=Pantherophis guttatus TaxID=94885 RepID=A0ABM3ZJQ2_PANGU|nr:uncharacterized protein LOC132712109 [Pantherophis guttatus]